MEKKNSNRDYSVTQKAELLTFLQGALPPKDAKNAKAMLKYRSVLVNGKVVTQYNHALRPGQTVTIKPPSKNESPLAKFIIFENDELLVMNKPAGLLSIASDSERDNTAYRLATQYMRDNNPRSRVFIVHRLDRDTSGVLLFAKNEQIKLQLQDNWANVVKTRGYTAIVEGIPEKSEDVLRSWLRESEKAHRVFESDKPGDGLEAITQYRVVRSSATHSMLDIRLMTGRKNQIRVQMSGIGHPVVGDKRYGATTNPLKRLALHAHLLEIEHPVTGEFMSFRAVRPRGFKV